MATILIPGGVRRHRDPPGTSAPDGRRLRTRLLSRAASSTDGRRTVTPVTPAPTVPRPRHGRPCASYWGAAHCELKVGHNYAHSAEVDGGVLSWENAHAPEGRLIAARKQRVALPDGFQALLQV
jgi:hypothetical protein